MHIKKLKHCCMVIDVKGSDGKMRRILTDPGFYSIEEHDKIKHADIVLITHEHQDHFHIESLKALIKRVPDVSIFTNDTVGEMLAKEGIEHRIMKHGDVVDHKGIHIEAYGKKHALLHKSIPQSSNIGFLITEVRPQSGEVRPPCLFRLASDDVTDDSRAWRASEDEKKSSLFFPGDAFTDPKKPVDVLALPTAGPWMKISEPIDYALKLKPRMAFPVHDGEGDEGFRNIFIEKILSQNGVEFVKLEDRGELELT